MDLKQLRALLAVSELRSFSAAARSMSRWIDARRVDSPTRSTRTVRGLPMFMLPPKLDSRSVGGTKICHSAYVFGTSVRGAFSSRFFPKVEASAPLVCAYMMSTAKAWSRFTSRGNETSTQSPSRSGFAGWPLT